MQKARYVRLCSDEAGASHFEDVEVSLDPVGFAPPAPLLNVAALFPASGCAFVGGPPEWGGGVPHPAPRRQVFCTLSGTYEVTASDGERPAACCSWKTRRARGIQPGSRRRPSYSP